MKNNGSVKKLLDKQMQELQKVFPTLSMAEGPKGEYIVTGNLAFSVEYKGKTVKDDYDIEIMISHDYPRSSPTVKEVGNKIPKYRDNHINDDGTLCLGAPLAVKKTFVQQRTLLWFVREQVVRFLFNHSCKRDYGIRPDDELSHGAKGLLEYYYDLFETRDNITVLEFLRFFADGRYDDQSLCPCGSGMKIRKCHYRLIKKVRRLHEHKEFRQELAQITSYLAIIR